MFAHAEENDQCALPACTAALDWTVIPAGDPTAEPVVFAQPGHERLAFCQLEHAVTFLNAERERMLGECLFRVRMGLFMSDELGVAVARREVEDVVWGAYGDYQLALQTPTTGKEGEGSDDYDGP